MAAIETSDRVIVEVLSGWDVQGLSSSKVLIPENPWEVDLGDGEVFADLIGDELAIVEQSEPCGVSHHAVLDRKPVAELLC